MNTFGILDAHDIFSHKVSGGRVIYDNVGIHFTTNFKHKFILDWSQIDSCSITPSLDKKNGTWVSYKGDKLEDLSYLEISLIVINLREKVNFWIFLWIIVRFKLKFLSNLNNKTLTKKSVITLKVDTKSLTVTREELVEFWSQKMKFKLIIM
jgi:hypothetical protein